MKRTAIVIFGVASALAALLLAAAVASGAALPAPARPPTLATEVVSYQGQVLTGGVPYSGTGYFKFAIVDIAGGVSFWSNDGSFSDGREPSLAVPLEVRRGLFAVLLGDISLPNMTQPLSAKVFADGDRALRVWFSADGSGFVALTPDRPIASVPFAMASQRAQQADDAGTLAGRAPGNGDGNVPLNNGTLNTNLNADLLDGSHASAFQQHYANVVTVAKSGGDYTTITAALNSITDATDTNRYLVKVMPGVYTEKVTMKSNVDIEGSGELATRIIGAGSTDPGTGTVQGAPNTELRFLTVENTGGTSYAVAIYTHLAALRLTHVTARASGAANSYGVFNSYSASTMQDVTASASGATNSFGVRNYYSSSPTMQNVTASASGGTNSFGVQNYNSSTTMRNVTASASGANYNYGVFNYELSLTMQNVTASASGANYNYAVCNLGASPTIQNSSLSASGGTSNYGVYNDGSPGSFTVRIDNSQVITASTATIHNLATFTTLVGASQLAGGAVTGGGTIICAGVYDENYAFSAGPACP